MHTLGFIGTGTITAAMVRGLKGSDLKDWPIVLSPRSTALSAELANSFPGVMVAADNQQVVTGSDVVILAIRPQDAEAVIRDISFRPDQRIISLVAALDIATIKAWTGVHTVTRAIPLTFVEQRGGVTPILPPDKLAAEIFTALGGVIELDDAAAFDAYATGSALMGTFFGIAEVAHGWLVARGLRAADAELYLRNLFGNLGDVIRDRPLSMAELREAHSTRGGLNELVYQRFMAEGGGKALTSGFDAVMARIEGQKAAS